MATNTMTYTGELVVVTCWCGINHAVPSSLRSHQLREKAAGRQFALYCPVGHQYLPADDSRERELEKILARERQQHDQTRAEVRTVRKQRESLKRANSALRGVVTRTKNRVSKGVCPCCNRHFRELQRHMDAKHPGWSENVDQTFKLENAQ